MAKFTAIGDEVAVNGFTVTARLEADDCGDCPWDREEGHGPVSEWTTRDKRPGERVLVTDRHSKRYYDVQGAMAVAKRDGWDAKPYGVGTAGERAARAVEADYERLRRWCADDWAYVGVVLTVSKGGVELSNHASSLWGIESDAGDYLAEVANELLAEAVEQGRELAKAVCECDEEAYVG